MRYQLPAIEYAVILPAKKRRIKFIIPTSKKMGQKCRS